MIAPKPTTKIDIIKRLEWIVAIACSAVVLVLSVVRATNAGALWRDEASSLQLAQMPTWTEIAANYQFDSFPFLFTSILRSYVGVFGASDASLRFFGLTIAAGFLCVAWFQSRSARDLPLLLPVLIGLNSTFLTSALWIRGYGLGAIMLLIAFTITARLIIDPRPRWMIAAFVAFFAAAQCLFFNIAFIGTISGAAIAVCVLRGRWRVALGLFAATALCGLSYIPYLMRYAGSKDWMVVLTLPHTLADTLHGLFVATGALAPLMAWAWAIIFFASITAAIIECGTLSPSRAAPEPDLLLFGVLTCIASVIACCAFLELLHHSSAKPQYFIVLLCVVAAGIDLINATFAARYRWHRVARLVVTATATVVLPFAAWPRIVERLTNIDIIAKTLEGQARPNDLIVVNPWFLGISFQRYYQGGSRWVTVPDINDHRTHRYDLVKTKMVQQDPLSDVFSAMRETGVRGDHVWVVGIAMAVDPDMPLPVLPAPHPQFGWSNQFYANAWAMELGQFIGSHFDQSETVVGPGDRVNVEEDAILLRVDGWQD